MAEQAPGGVWVEANDGSLVAIIAREASELTLPQQRAVLEMVRSMR